jgi:Lon protease-like protein
MPSPRSDRGPWSLPLFPLRTVLFPGGLLPLKVFEQRYVEMTKACLRDERPFGVCMITKGEEVAQAAGDVPEFADVGTLARITNFDMPQLGILHLQTEGLTRFQVRRHAVDASGLVIGDVTAIAEEPHQRLTELYAPLAKILELIAARLGAQNFPAEVHYDDASWVGYRLA